MIDQVTIDKIMDAAQIQDVVSDYVTLRKRGVNLVGLCPFHNEKPSSPPYLLPKEYSSAWLRKRRKFREFHYGTRTGELL